MGEISQENLKKAFAKVKGDISFLSQEISEIKESLTENKKELKEIISSLKTLQEQITGLKTNSSTGNEGADQTINQTINQSNADQSNDQSKKPISAFNDLYKPNKGSYEADHLITDQSNDQSITRSLADQSPITRRSNDQSEQIKGFTTNISAIFLSLSKQELKTFLTIYQLEDEGIKPTYRSIGLKMQLSEHRIRGHLSSLLRKNVPLTKKRLGQNTTLLSVSEEFRALGLKQKLINLYYDSDPHQKTLFNI